MFAANHMRFNQTITCIKVEEIQSKTLDNVDAKSNDQRPWDYRERLALLKERFSLFLSDSDCALLDPFALSFWCSANYSGFSIYTPYFGNSFGLVRWHLLKHAHWTS